MIKPKEMDLDKMRRSLIKTAMKTYNVTAPTEEDLEFLAKETRRDVDYVKAVIKDLEE